MPTKEEVIRLLARTERHYYSYPLGTKECRQWAEHWRRLERLAKLAGLIA